MGKNKIVEAAKNKETDIPDFEPEENIQEWVCIKECYFSEDGNPILAKRWRTGEAIFAEKKPGKHFVTRAAFDAGAGGRAEYFKKITKFGGKIEPWVKELDVPALRHYAQELERAWRRKQITS